MELEARDDDARASDSDDVCDRVLVAAPVAQRSLGRFHRQLGRLALEHLVARLDALVVVQTLAACEENDELKHE